MNFKTIFNYLFFVSITALTASCGSSTSEGDVFTDVDAIEFTQKEKNNKVQKIFSSIQSQSETTSMLDAAEAKYDSKLLNPIENTAKYSSVKSRALNLGVYGMDLGVTNIFGQTQESMLYLRCANKMSTSLGISGAFDEKMSERIEASSDDKDSLLAIITDSYKNADNYLQENGQAGVSTLMVAGGWLEGLYIASQIACITESDAIIRRIDEEKGNLNTIISLLEDCKTDTDGANEVLTDFNALKEVFDNEPLEITLQKVKLISEKITEMRNKIIE